MILLEASQTHSDDCWLLFAQKFKVREYMDMNYTSFQLTSW